MIQLFTVHILFLFVLIHAKGILSHRIPSNSIDPDYFAQSGVGGQSSGGDGSVVIVTKQPTELRSSFFHTGSPQTYAVPGNSRRHPYEQRVDVKLWGAGGGGCDGGRVATLSESDDDLSSGSAGEYVHASFILPIGEVLIVEVGGGGQSRSKGSRSQTLLGGLGGYNGGKSGYRDQSSEGGGGGGMSKISFSNGTIIAAAFGGHGGGNTTYCTALGGQGGRLKGINNGGFINSELALLDDITKENAISPSTILATHEDEDEAIPLLNNQWIPVTITQEAVTISEANTTNNDARSWCEHSSHRPTGRRGHSMTAVNNHVYIFGGATSKCLCKVTNGEKNCFSTNVYSNELWHFDVPSSTFTLLESSGEGMPQGREQHSATVLPSGDILIIGGLSSSDETITKDFHPLNEVWRLTDPHRITTHVISGINLSNTTLPMQLNQSSLSSHTVNIDLDDDVCVEDLQLSLSLDHGCPQGIEYISLTSPSISSEQNSSHSSQRRQHQNKLYVSTAENRERDCIPSLFNLSFSDKAEESVLSYSGMPNEGSYIPATSLKHFFRSMPANGEWTLTISTSQRLVEFNASLLEWELHMHTKSCTPRVEWEQISVPSSFQPRYGHTAIVVDSDSIFISGGMNHRRLNDLWRFNYLSNTWTQLNAPALQSNPTIQRQEAVIGPWSLLHYGGLKPRSGALSRGQDLSIRNLFTDERLKVSNPEGKLGPHGRYLTSVALMNSTDVINRLYNIDGPFLLMFGGDRGHSINAYPNSYGFMPNTFLGDVWILSLSELNTHHVLNKNDYCIGRLDHDSTHYQIWNASCGWEASVGGEPEVCEPEEILILAWCQQRYQHFHTY